MRNIKMIGLLWFVVIMFLASQSNSAFQDKFMCHCGVFRTVDEPPKQLPLLEKVESIMVVPNEDKKLTCLKHCNIIAKAEKENAPVRLCYVLKREGLKYNRIDGVALYSRLCGEPKKWVITGAIHAVPICCRDGVPITCVADSSTSHTN